MKSETKKIITSVVTIFVSYQTTFWLYEPRRNTCTGRDNSESRDK